MRNLVLGVFAAFAWMGCGSAVPDGSENLFGLSVDGTFCRDSSECSSTYCVNGICCESACNGGLPGCSACIGSITGAPDGTCALVLASARYVCRASMGGCDAAELCDGASAVCPADSVRAAGYACRPAGGPCDVAESCDGVSKGCPADSLKAAGNICKAAGASPLCDPADECDGVRKLCPSRYAPAGTPCGLSMSCTGLGLCR